jgi:hypothetical protein
MSTNIEGQFDKAVKGRIDVCYRYDTSNPQRMILAWRNGLVQKGFGIENAQTTAEALAEKYQGLDFRVVDRIIRLGELLARSEGQALSLEVIEEALALHGNEATISFKPASESEKSIDDGNGESDSD